MSDLILLPQPIAAAQQPIAEADVVACLNEELLTHYDVTEKLGVGMHRPGWLGISGVVRTSLALVSVAALTLILYQQGARSFSCPSGRLKTLRPSFRPW